MEAIDYRDGVNQSFRDPFLCDPGLISASAAPGIDQSNIGSRTHIWSFGSGILYSVSTTLTALFLNNEYTIGTFGPLGSPTPCLACISLAGIMKAAVTGKVNSKVVCSAGWIGAAR
jgi:hypothetical protein